MVCARKNIMKFLVQKQIILGVNVINVKRANFSYKFFWQSQNVTRKTTCLRKISYVKRWWNWLKESILPTSSGERQLNRSKNAGVNFINIYVHVFCTNVVSAAFFLVWRTYVRKKSCQNDIRMKNARAFNVDEIDPRWKWMKVKKINLPKDQSFGIIKMMMFSWEGQFVKWIGVVHKWRHGHCEYFKKVGRLY